MTMINLLVGDKCDIIVSVKELSFSRGHSRTDQMTHQCRDTLIFGHAILPTNDLAGFIKTRNYQTQPSIFLSHFTWSGSNIFEHRYIMFYIFLIHKYEPINQSTKILPLQKMPFHILNLFCSHEYSSFGFLLKFLQRNKKCANFRWHMTESNS